MSCGLLIISLHVVPQCSSTLGSSPDFQDRLLTTSLDITEKAVQGLMSLLHAPPLVFLISRSFVPGTCTRSWVSSRVFCSHLDPSTTSILSSVLSYRNHGLLESGKESKRRKEERRKTLFRHLSTVCSPPWFILSSKLWSRSVIQRFFFFFFCACSEKSFHMF